MDKELIKISEENGIKTVSARTLHEKLEVKTEFAHWFTRMCEYGFEEGIDFTVVKNDRGGKGYFASIEYYISLDMAKEICMLQRSEIGQRFRQYFIECEKKLNNNPILVSQKSKEELAVADKEARSSIANIYLRLSEKYSDNKDYSQILDAYATKAIEDKFVLPLPKLEEESFSATEVGKMLGVSSNKVGGIAKKLNIKINGEYGKWYVDKSPYLSKEVNVFRYTQKAIDLIKKELA